MNESRICHRKVEKMMDAIWKEMYDAAKAVQNGRVVTLGQLTPEWWV